MASKVDACLRANDTRQAWSQMRILGGTGRRERKRNVKDVKRFDPSVGDWADAMAESGCQGGCEVQVVQFLEEGQDYDRKVILDVEAEVGHRPSQFPFVSEGTTKGFQSMKYLRGVPQGRARKELYQMAMEGDVRIAGFYTNLYNQSYMQSKTLGTWELADAAQLDKHNGKPGTKGVRLIMMLDPVGKSY